MERKTLNVASSADLKSVDIVGNPDLFEVLSKTSCDAEGWMKSTKAMEVDSVGCLVQVTTQQRNPDGSYAVAEALTFVPGVRIVYCTEGGAKLEQAGWR